MQRQQDEMLQQQQQQQQQQRENYRRKQEDATAKYQQQQDETLQQQQQQLQLVTIPKENKTRRHQTKEQKQRQKTVERKEELVLISATSGKDRREDAVNLKRNAAQVQVLFESNFVVNILCDGRHILDCDRNKPVRETFVVGAKVCFMGEDKTYTDYTVPNTLVGVQHRIMPLPVIDLPLAPYPPAPPQASTERRLTRSASKQRTQP